jgi:hypothetical protein
MLQHVAQGLVVPLVPAADAHQPEVPVVGRKFCHQDVGIHEPVRGNLLHHDGQRFGGNPQMFRECGQQLRPRPHPVLAGLRKLHQLCKIIDELPQFFIHAQTLSVPVRKPEERPSAGLSSPATRSSSGNPACAILGGTASPGAVKGEGHVYAKGFVFQLQRQ